MRELASAANAILTAPSDHLVVVVGRDDANERSIRSAIQDAGYRVSVAGSGGEAVRLQRRNRVGIFIIGAFLPDMSGLALCRRLRSESSIPIILVASSSSEEDRLLGLECGADACLAKSVSLRELLARLAALLRKEPGNRPFPTPAVDAFLNFTMDRHARRVTIDGTEVPMSAKEFDLLSFLLANSGRVVSRDELLAEVWGYDYGGQGKTLYVHLTWLRAKLERAPFTITTVLHAGYRLDRLPTRALTTASREAGSS